MLKCEKLGVWNFEGAFRGLRNPLESWHLSDSDFYSDSDIPKIGENDLALARRLIKAGADHRKFLRQILVSVDITAPLYWWKEFDQYKVGTVTNSTSTMHKLGSRLLVPGDFSWDVDDVPFVSTYRQRWLNDFNYDIKKLQAMKREQKETNGADPQLQEWIKKINRRLVQDLPCSYNQLRTVTMNYEVLRNIYKSRKNHKLTEWHTFCDWIESLPYAEFITCE